MGKKQTFQGVRPAGRSSAVREAVLAATLRTLIADGYAALSVEAVASRAGVNKTTVYRRWATRDDLLADALATWSQEAIPIPDTGSVDTDMLALGGALAEQLNGGVGQQVAAAMLAASHRSQQLREATRNFFDQQRVRATPLVRRAVERGELPSDTDVDALLTTFRAPFFYRVVTTGDLIDEHLITQAAHVALTAARAGVLSAQN
ncbi:transcriptional regulator, TetR family [Segniliparus rotundus DSM 44985]|uniref:Transcriptional regulator, TetR family n=1 Tax=Segniliparus rotundus (strain ATCC BAA-972 / CDC 1076 / CIP 108378 / DSM 44985 / JCM 13578) TaxID=640132 RepID=D6ZEH1_SEGRD|nr:TetR/AcrR family transcriptional regulator [Segniliparus rotundus]ADG99447.1 transcriptional regulator, TetR family [Segniliparus rotundus DSM 44985]